MMWVCQPIGERQTESCRLRVLLIFQQMTLYNGGFSVCGQSWRYMVSPGEIVAGNESYKTSCSLN